MTLHKTALILKKRVKSDKSRGKRFQMTLSAQLMLVMTGLVVGIIAICFIVNNIFLAKVYQHHKKQEMLEAFSEINQASLDGTLTDETFDIPFERICANGNISIFITEPTKRSVVRSSLNDIQDLQLQLSQMMRNPNRNSLTILEETDSYTLIQSLDDRMNSDYLVIFGTLANGEIIYMRSALESIRESAAITNQFFAEIGACLLILSFILIYFLSRSISQPIKDMTTLSKRMTELDFNAKYQPGYLTVRELEELGDHMNELSETLEETITELKVANNELKQDIKKREEIDEMRKEFISNVSHELKTPIALISGYAEGLKEFIDEDPETREFYCDVIMDESEKMGSMVKKLLTLNQLEFGNDALEMERFDITEVVRGVSQSSELLAVQEGITIDFEENQPAYVWGDAFKIEEVITNYLSNAIHYALGEKKVRLFYTRHDQLLRFSVFNTGNPIPEDDLDKVWIKFYKVDKARTREYGGSGIGLSIVKAIMDSHHQQCGVINHENGVEFWMELEMA